MTGKEAIKIIQKLGVSQRQFAFMIGVHPNSVSKWATSCTAATPDTAGRRGG